MKIIIHLHVYTLLRIDFCISLFTKIKQGHPSPDEFSKKVCTITHIGSINTLGLAEQKIYIVKTKFTLWVG